MSISDEFADALCSGGSIRVDCGFCNRTHFSGAENFFEEGEYEKLCRKVKEDPDHYVHHEDTDSISWGYIDGIAGVHGCECGGLEKYEKFIWKNRYLIASYLKRRSEKERKDSQRQSGQLEGVVAALEGREM